MRTLTALISIFAATALAAATDVLTVGTVSAPKGTILVPVYVRDLSGTPLGMDKPSGQRIQALAFKVTFSPASSITGATFTRGGALAKTPLFESSVQPQDGSAIAYVASFDESNNALQFTSNAAAPGTLIGHLSLTTHASVSTGAVINLLIDSGTAMLSNQAGTLTETVANGGLSLQNGSITIAAGSCDPLQSVSVSISGVAGACTLGTGGTATATPVGGGAVTYQWGYRTTPSGSIASISGATSSSYVISGPDFDGPGTKYLVVTATPSCGGIVTSSNTPISITTAPAVTLTAGSAVYANEPGNFASVEDLGPGGVYNWSVTNGTITAGQGTPHITYTAGASGNVTIGVAVTQSGCSNGATPQAVVPIIARPVGATMAYLILPCRLIDTREGTPLGPHEERAILIATLCGIPEGTKAIAANVTVISPPDVGWLSLFPANAPWPGTSSVSYRTGKTRASNGIFRLAPNGQLIVKNEGTGVNVVIDVTGYFK